MSNCHFTIIMSRVQSTLRNIRLSVNFRLIFGLGHGLLLRLSVERGGVIKSPRSVFLFFVGVEIVGLYRLLRARSKNGTFVRVKLRYNRKLGYRSWVIALCSILIAILSPCQHEF